MIKSLSFILLMFVNVRGQGSLCQCDNATGVFCSDNALKNIVNCGLTLTGKKCARQVMANEDNSNFDCSCMNYCVSLPTNTCSDESYDYCWRQAKTGCSDDDDNQSNCVYYCQKYYISSLQMNCVSKPIEWTACESSCNTSFRNDSNQDGPTYATCMVQCDIQWNNVYLRKQS